MGRSSIFDDAIIKGSPQSRKWVFTLFDTTIDFKDICEINSNLINYLYTGLETAPKTGKLHYQGFIQFKRALRRKQLQTILNNKCWCNPMKGSFKDNEAYCSKQKHKNVWFEFGTWSKQGQRNDLLNIKDMIDKGATMMQVAQDHFGDYIRYHRGLEKYKSMYDKKTATNRRNVKVTLICGPTGSGKTSSVLDKHNDDVYTVEFSHSNIWWDGYEDEKVILLDDYDNNFRITRLLRILDQYKLQIPIKGGFKYAKWDEVYITTNLRIDELHSNAKREHRNALFRRVTSTINLYDKSGTKCRGNTDPPLLRLADLLDNTHTDYGDLDM